MHVALPLVLHKSGILNNIPTMTCYEKAFLALLSNDLEYKQYQRGAWNSDIKAISQSPSVCLFMDWIYGLLLPLFLAVFPFWFYIGGEAGAITL